MNNRMMMMNLDMKSNLNAIKSDPIRQQAGQMNMDYKCVTLKPTETLQSQSTQHMINMNIKPIKSDVMHSQQTASGQTGVAKKKRKRCGECPGCYRKDNCLQCGPCKSTRSHQICKMRKCEQLKTKKEKQREVSSIFFILKKFLVQNSNDSF